MIRSSHRLRVLGWFGMVSACLVAAVRGEEATVDAEAVVRYVESCRKPNGAFGPLDQEYTDAAWNYPAVLAMQLLEAKITRPEAIVEHGLGAPAGHAGLGHLQFFHQHALRELLGRPIEPKHRQVKIYHQGIKPSYYASPLGTESDLLFKSGGRPNPDPLDVEADTFYYHNLASLWYLLEALEKSGRKPAEPRPLVDYILRRQSATGFADVRAADAYPTANDVHIVHTAHAVACLKMLGVAVPQKDALVTYIHACRDKQGAYRWNPRTTLPGNEPDVLYVWAALKTLQLLDAQPQESEKTIAWLNSLQNVDGGFGDRPGWRSRLMSTAYAVQALGLLGKPARTLIATKSLPKPEPQTIADGEFGIYQAQFKMPVVQPAELAGLGERGFNLLAIKSDKWSDAEPLLAEIRRQKLPMDVVLCPEEYPHRHSQLGGVLLNHVGNFTLDPRWTAEQREVWQLADTAGTDHLDWLGYRDRVVKPTSALGALVYPEQDYEMEYAYIAYGNDRRGERGYNAVLAGFNWLPLDFVRVFPWRERYVDRLTPIADVDAHGDLEKWSKYLDLTRTLYIAKGPSYADFQEAVAAGRVVTVIVGAEGVASGVTFYGPKPAVDYARRHLQDWKWW